MLITFSIPTTTEHSPEAEVLKLTFSTSYRRLAMKTFNTHLVFLIAGNASMLWQWVLLGLEDKGIKEIAARNSTIFAVTTDSALYRLHRVMGNQLVSQIS